MQNNPQSLLSSSTKPGSSMDISGKHDTSSYSTIISSARGNSPAQNQMSNANNNSNIASQSSHQQQYHHNHHHQHHNNNNNNNHHSYGQRGRGGGSSSNRYRTNSFPRQWDSRGGVEGGDSAVGDSSSKSQQQQQPYDRLTPMGFAFSFKQRALERYRELCEQQKKAGGGGGTSDPLAGVVFHSDLKDLIQAEVWLKDEDAIDGDLVPFPPTSLTPFSVEEERAVALGQFSGTGGGSGGYHQNTNRGGSFHQGNQRASSTSSSANPSLSSSLPKDLYHRQIMAAGSLGRQQSVSSASFKEKNDYRGDPFDNSQRSNINNVFGRSPGDSDSNINTNNNKFHVNKNDNEDADDDDVPRMVHTLSDLESDGDDLEHHHHRPHAGLADTRQSSTAASGTRHGGGGGGRYGGSIEPVAEEEISWAAVSPTGLSGALGLGTFDERGNFVLGGSSAQPPLSPSPRMATGMLDSVGGTGFKVMASPMQPKEDAMIAPNAPVTSSAPATSTSNNTRWFYRDPAGNVQGPFSNQKMLDWYNRQYFPETLPLRRESGDLVFETLGGWKVRCGGQVPFAPGALDELVEVPSAPKTLEQPAAAAMPAVLQSLFGMSLASANPPTTTTSSPQILANEPSISRINLSDPVDSTTTTTSRSVDAAATISKRQFLAQLVSSKKEQSTSTQSSSPTQQPPLSPSVQQLMSMAASGRGTANNASAIPLPASGQVQVPVPPASVPSSGPAWGKIHSTVEPILIEKEQQPQQPTASRSNNRSKPTEYRPLRPEDQAQPQAVQQPTWSMPMAAKQPPKSLIEIQAEEALREQKERERRAREEQQQQQSNPGGKSFASMLKQATNTTSDVQSSPVTAAAVVKGPAFVKAATAHPPPPPQVKSPVTKTQQPFASTLPTPIQDSKEQMIRAALASHLALSQVDEATCTSLLLETTSVEETIAFIRDNLVTSKPTDGGSGGVVGFARAVLQIVHGPGILADRVVVRGLAEIEALVGSSSSGSKNASGLVAGGGATAATSADWDTVSHGRRGGKGGKHR